MTTVDYYTILNIPRDSSENEIKKAYRNMALGCHPDKSGGNNINFIRIKDAYDVLVDPEKRREYDNSLNEREGYKNISDIIKDLGIKLPTFGNIHINKEGEVNFDMSGSSSRLERKKVKKPNREHKINISQEEAYNGGTRKIILTLYKTCFEPDCKKICDTCNGSGYKLKSDMNNMFIQFTEVCNECKDGIVDVINKGCDVCHGELTYKKIETHQLTIKPGVCDNDTFLFKGLGDQRDYPTDEDGDLIIIFTVDKDEYFTREGNDLHYGVNLTWRESVVGKEITIPHYTGEFSINLKKFTVIQPFKKYIIKGYGMPIKDKSPITYGDLVMSFTITSYPDLSSIPSDEILLI